MIIRALQSHKLIRLLFIALALGVMSIQAQEVARALLEVFERYAEGLAELVKAEFPSRDMADLNYKGAASISAIPPSVSPVDQLSQLEEGKTIGALVLSKGSDRLKLPPGIFRVFVLKRNSVWTVRFFDARDSMISEAPASVTEAPRVPSPYASVDHSVCVRFDETLVCY
jgi:hypothetical protein